MTRKLFAGMFFAALPLTFSAHAVAESVHVSGQAECVTNAWAVTWTADVAADGYTIEGYSPGAGSWHGGPDSTSIVDTYPLDQADTSMAVSVYVNGTVVAMDNAVMGQPDGCEVTVSRDPSPTTTTTPPPAVIIPGVNDVPYVAPTIGNAATPVAQPDAPAPVAERLPVVTQEPTATTAPPVPTESFPPSFMGWPAVVLSPPW